MSKSDQNQAKSLARGQTDKNNQNEAAASSTLNGILGTAQGNASNILPGVTSGYSDIATTGGGSDPIARETYTKLATTGGISPEDAQAIKSEASDAARSTYQTGQAQASRTAAATGGYGDTSAVQALLARQGSEAAANASTNSQAELARIKQPGQIAGAQGLAAGQQSQTSNKLAALSGQSNIYGMNEQQINTTVGQILQNYQQTGTLNNQDLAILTNLANQPGVFDKIVGTIGTLGGAAAGVLGAIHP